LRASGNLFTIRHISRSGRGRYRAASGGQPMRAFIVEITAKLIVRSDT
jgi:hypothetical protein